MKDGKLWIIEVKKDSSGEVVRRLEYPNEARRDRALSGLMRQMNIKEYTAYLIDPE